MENSDFRLEKDELLNKQDLMLEKIENDNLRISLQQICCSLWNLKNLSQFKPSTQPVFLCPTEEFPLTRGF